MDTIDRNVMLMPIHRALLWETTLNVLGQDPYILWSHLEWGAHVHINEAPIQSNHNKFYQIFNSSFLQFCQSLLLHKRNQISDSFLHDTSRLDDLRQKHTTRAEQITNDGHSLWKKHTINCRVWENNWFNLVNVKTVKDWRSAAKCWMNAKMIAI